MVYTITDNKRITELDSLVTTADKSVPICLLFDDDADGVSSGTATFHYLKSKGFDQIMCYTKAKDRPLFSDEFLENLAALEVEIIICVDFEPISWQFITQEKLQDIPFDVCIIDHHQDQTEMYDNFPQSQRKRIFIHPFNCSDSDNPGQYCTSKFVYDLLSQIQDMSEFEWKIIPGMIGDMNIIKWGEYVQLVAKQYNYDLSESYFENPFGEFATIVGFAAAIGADEVEEVFNHFLNSENIEQAIEKKEDFAQMFDEFNRVQHSFEEESEYDKKTKLFFININSQFKITSMVSSAISYAHPEKRFFFYHLDPETKIYSISMRAQNCPIHFGKLLQHVTSKFEKARGGGHKQAAGAGIQEQYLEQFKDEVKKAFYDFEE